MVAWVCFFIRQKFLAGLRKIPCTTPEVYRGELFRTDAKCEDGRIVLGGWTLSGAGGPMQASWFSFVGQHSSGTSGVPSSVEGFQDWV